MLANEIAPHRAAFVARAVAAGALRAASGPVGTGPADNAQVIVGDGTAPAWRPGSFDRVLADVPCTGLGALRRRPEARWRRVPEDLDGLVRLQRALLRAALDAARPGGAVAYVTCSPHLAETRGVAEQVLADVRSGGRDVDLLDARLFLPRVPDLGAGPYVQLWPHRHGTDAIFLALMRPGPMSP